MRGFFFIDLLLEVTSFALLPVCVDNESEVNVNDNDEQSDCHNRLVHMVIDNIVAFLHRLDPHRLQLILHFHLLASQLDVVLLLNLSLCLPNITNDLDSEIADVSDEKLLAVLGLVLHNHEHEERACAYCCRCSHYIQLVKLEEQVEPDECA